MSNTGGGGTHVEDTTYFIEFQPPNSDLFTSTAVLRVEDSGKHIPFGSFDDVTPDPSHGPAIERLLSEASGVYVGRLTHVVNCSIASRTGRLGW